ncbi:MAG: hypothetical protein ACRC6V_05210 [Bacteroidales bacterium]
MGKPSKSTLNNGSFTQYPNKLRKTKTDTMSPMSKLCFVILMFEKKRSNSKPFTPSYGYMKKHYDINSKVWKNALDELQSEGYISVDVVSIKPRKISISINKEHDKGKAFSMFPNVILLTDVYTNNQKIFIGTLFGEFLKDFRVSGGRIALTPYQICKKLTDVDFKKSYIYETLKELSSPDSGFLNILIKDDGGSFYMDFSVFNAISDRLLEKLYVMHKAGWYERSEYLPPVKGQYKYSHDTLSIIEDTDLSNMVKVKKAYKPRISTDERDILEESVFKLDEMNRETQYANQHEEINQYMKANGL